MEAASPSPWLAAFADALRIAARRGPVLDLACGRGRHARAAAALGARCLAIDRDREALAELARASAAPGRCVQALCADLETPHGIPVATGSCAAVLVFRFLFRPLAREIERVLRPGGLLLYETFSVRQRELGRGPRNPSFLLAPGELPRLFPGLEVIAYQETLRAEPEPEHVASLAARKPGG